MIDESLKVELLMPIIKTVNLTKKYKDLVAVNSLNLEIQQGECFGLLGPNGAGKTSLIRLLTAVSPPTSGEIWIDGKDLYENSREVKARLGLVPQLDNLDPDLKVLQNLLTFARYFDIPKSEAYQRSMVVLRLFQLEDKKDSRIKELSGGMKRRLLIARGLINNPVILILDEPSAGLDPQSRHLVWQKLKELKLQGVTQLLCTQNMDEAELLCDRVAVMHLGKILVVGTPGDLISKYVGRQVWEVPVDSASQDIIISQIKARGLESDHAAGVIQVFHSAERPVESPDARVRPATLEDVFFKLTGRSLVE
jgi:lipooligosaccharide transport system ATP-binding protein